jgi:hypothetical protein
MTFDLKAQLMVDLGNWQKGLTKASKQMDGFGKSMKTISNGVKAAWAGLAVVGIGALFDGIVDVAKAAAVEEQSMNQLRNALNNSWKATDTMAAAQEEFVRKLAYTSAITDDKIRPAYAKLVLVTKSASKAQKMFGIVLDTSVGASKDLNAVSQAMAKYLGGNKAAFDKLIPGIKNVTDKIGFLEKNYANAAETVGNSKPFEKIQIIFDDLKEKLGSYILPYVKEFATWLSGDEAKKMMDDMFKTITNFVTYINSPEGRKGIDDFVTALKDIAAQILKIAAAVTGNKGVFELLFGINKKNPMEFLRLPGSGDTTFGNQLFPNTDSKGPNGAPVTINVYAPSVDAQNVIKSLQASARSKGVSLQSLLR